MGRLDCTYNSLRSNLIQFTDFIFSVSLNSYALPFDIQRIKPTKKLGILNFMA